MKYLEWSNSETERRMVVARGGGMGEMGVTVYVVQGFSFVR